LRLATLLLIPIFLSPTNWWLDDYGFDSITELDGSGIKVAVIDTGIDDSHPDLIGTVVGGVDFSGVGTPDGTTPVGSSAFHGSMVASLIAGQGRLGVLGIAPRAELLSISIGLGVPGANTDQQIANGIIWAVDQGAQVINLSLSRNSMNWPISWDRAFSYAFQNDVVIIAASGNRSEDNSRPTAPATIPGVISVAGVSREKLGSTSAATQGISVTITAPGEDLAGAFPKDQVRLFSGSSAAAPIVSGLVALMRQADPKATANDIIQRLIGSAEDLGEPGFDAIYGFGLINPLGAVQSELVSDSNPLGSLDKWVELYRPELMEPEPGANQLLQEPKAPEKLLDQVAELPPTDEPGSERDDLWGFISASNPLLYWLLAPLAPLLWLLLRNWRKKAPRG
jgi:subtilisin family serine protease